MFSVSTSEAPFCQQSANSQMSSMVMRARVSPSPAEAPLTILGTTVFPCLLLLMAELYIDSVWDSLALLPKEEEAPLESFLF